MRFVMQSLLFQTQDLASLFQFIHTHIYLFIPVIIFSQVLNL